MSLEKHLSTKEPVVKVQKYRKELLSYETRIKKAEENLARRLQKK